MPNPCSWLCISGFCVDKVPFLMPRNNELALGSDNNVKSPNAMALNFAAIELGAL